MADTKLANLTASGALTGTELFYADNGSQDVNLEEFLEQSRPAV